MRILFVCALLMVSIISWIDPPWLVKKQKQFDVFYTKQDKKEIRVYNKMILNGVRSTEIFFNSSYDHRFFIFIHPDRNSLDSTWAHDWNEKGFRSECWMVGSGTGKRFDLLSPLAWEKQACEHQYSNKEKTGQLITHELVHVFHGQKQIKPDFSNTESLDWFVEGLATYASGQLDAEKIASLKTLVAGNNTPSTLDKFWTGKFKYPLSGSVVMYIDKVFGMDKLVSLLPLSKKEQVLSTLNLTEEKLLEDWRKFIAAM